MASPSINTLTSFSGADLAVTFANQAIGELQQLSWGVQREKAPVFTLGSADMRSVSRNKRAIAGDMVFAMLDHDPLIAAIQRVWDQIAPPAMFTPAANVTIRNSENLLDAIDMIKWNKTVSQAAQDNYKVSGKDNQGFGFIGSGALTPIKQEGSNGGPAQFDSEYAYFVDKWGKGEDVYVPAGFAPLRGENIQYSDQLPPLTRVSNIA